jgi:hypothetical protein
MDNPYQHIAWHPLSQVFHQAGYICLNQHKEELVLGYFTNFVHTVELIVLMALKAFDGK